MFNILKSIVLVLGGGIAGFAATILGYEVLEKWRSR